MNKLLANIRIAFSVQYNGRDFFGFQLQKSQRTVQGELEKAFATILRLPVRVFCSGRTDTGVHALAQVIHIELPDESAEIHPPDLHRLIYAVNCILPDDVSVIHGQIMSCDFHSRFSCRGREYIYRIVNAPYKMAMDYGSCYWERAPLDIEKMRMAVRPLIGEHDFAAFTPVLFKRSGEVTMRRMQQINFVKVGVNLYVHYVASGFLHNMIRILTGSLIDIGRGRMDVGGLERALHSKNRLDAGVTIPPQGLYFAYAKYDDYVTPPELIPLREIVLNNILLK